MACRGVHFAITPDEAQAFIDAADDPALMAIVERIETAWETAYLAESDKAWDAMHRALTDGGLEDGNGEYPLNHCVLGPRQLHEGDEYIISVVLPDEVRDVAQALEPLNAEWMRQRYDTVVPRSYAPEYGPEDRDYTAEHFETVRELYLAAARDGRAVVFTVDQ